MSIEISQEAEARLAAAARRLGISVDTFMARLISEHTTLTKPAHPASTVPVWHLGSAGVFHRRDIYDDAD
jgi:hypothetical protein